MATVRYERVYSLEDHENERFSIEVNCADDMIVEAMIDLRGRVEHLHAQNNDYRDEQRRYKMLMVSYLDYIRACSRSAYHACAATTIHSLDDLKQAAVQAYRVWITSNPDLSFYEDVILDVESNDVWVRHWVVLHSGRLPYDAKFSVAAGCDEDYDGNEDDKEEEVIF